MTEHGIRRWVAGLCAVLLLSGCGTGFYQTEGEDAVSGSAMMEVAQVQETDATPAGLEDHAVRQLTAGADGEPLLVTTDAQAIPHAYRRENGEWLWTEKFASSAANDFLVDGRNRLWITFIEGKIFCLGDPVTR